MSTANDLLIRIEERCRSLWQGDGDQHDAGTLASGWSQVAEAALRGLQLLDSDTHVVAALSDLAALPRWGDPDHRMVRLAEVLGVLADLLSVHLDVVHEAGVAERTYIAVRIQAALNVAAGATLRQSAQPDWGTGAIADLQDATEVSAMLPTRPNGGVLENLSIQQGNAGLLAMVKVWSAAALPILSGSTQLTGYAMQSTALVLAALCDVGVEILRAETVERLESLQARRSLAVDALTSASQRWRVAAAWPAHVRLGGRSAELRQATARVSTVLRDGVAQVNFIEFVGSLRLALPVARAHADGMQRLHDQGQVWVAVARLPAQYQALHHGTLRSGWVLETGRRVASAELAARSRSALQQLERSQTSAGSAVAVTRRHPSAEPLWESVQSVAMGHPPQFGLTGCGSPGTIPDLTP